MSRINLIFGDIVSSSSTKRLDAIVNAANIHLQGGGGVDGAIHAAAGPGLLKECIDLGQCPTGEAVLTSSYNLKTKYIIHTVGPEWNGGNEGEADLLASCYKNSLRISSENEIHTIAFPAISTGAFSFPANLAAQIAIKTTRDFLSKSSLPKRVIFFPYDVSSMEYYIDALLQEGKPMPDIEEFLEEKKSECFAFPDRWDQFYDYLSNNKKPDQKSPPVPLILNACVESSANKHLRIKEQVEWAREAGIEERAMTYLNASNWTKDSIERWDITGHW